MSKNAIKIMDEATALLWKTGVIDNLKAMATVPEPMVADLMQWLRPHYKPKGHLLLDPYLKYHTDATYLRSGKAKLYVINARTGKLQILHIWKKGDCIVIFKMFIERQENTKYYISLTANAELVSISNDCMDIIFARYPVAYQLMANILAEKSCRRLRHIELLTSDKAARPALFDELFPDLRNELSNQDKSAFIGTGESTLFRANHEHEKTIPPNDSINTVK